MHWNNSLTKTLHINYPIIQAPMLGVSTPAMAAAVSNQGGLGSLAVGGMSPEVTRQLIRQTKALTSKPFAVNLFVHDIPSYTEDELAPMRQLILKLARKKNYTITSNDLNNFQLYTYHDQLEILIEENISIISFTFGCLEESVIRSLHSKECTLIGTATCLEEALFLQQHNIDMVAVQGIEAGGHRGTFFPNIPLPQIGLFTLLTQIVNAVKIPCIAAGAINNEQTMKAAFDLGAAAVQIGTAFIGTGESMAIASYKEKLTSAKDADSALTRSFSGRWARGIRNQLLDDIEQSGIEIPPYPLQNSLTAKLRRLAQQHDDAAYTNLWAGQSVSLDYQGKNSAEVFRSLVDQYEKIMTL